MVAWQACVSGRSTNGGCCATPDVVAACVEPRRVQLLASDTKPGQARPEALSSFGTCGHDIAALLLDPERDVVYTVGADGFLRCWDIKSTAQRWSWECPDGDTIGVLRMREDRQAAQSCYLRFQGEARLFVVGHHLWLAGPKALRAFDRRTGSPLWSLAFDERHAALSLVHAAVAVTVEVPALPKDAEPPPEDDGCLEMAAYAADSPKKAELWRQPLKQGAAVHWLCAHAGRLHYVSRKGDEQQLVARNLERGVELWRRPHLAGHATRITKLEAGAGLLFVFCGLSLSALGVGNGHLRWTLELGARVDANGYFLCTKCVAVWLPPGSDEAPVKVKAKKRKLTKAEKLSRARRKVVHKLTKAEKRVTVAAAATRGTDVPPEGARVFISDGSQVHAVDARSGSRLEGWGDQEGRDGRLKLTGGYGGQPPASLSCIDAGARGSGDLLVLQRRVHHTSGGRHVATSLEARAAESGALRWTEASERAQTVQLHGGAPDGLVGVTQPPRVGEAAPECRTLYVFRCKNGALRTVHRVPHVPHRGQGKPGRPPREGELWRFVQGGLVVLARKTSGAAKPDAADALGLDVDVEQPRGAPAPVVDCDRLEFRRHKRKHKRLRSLCKGQDLNTLLEDSSARLDLTAAAAAAAEEVPPRWVWSEETGKRIEGWTLHGKHIFVLTDDNKVHVITLSKGKEVRSFLPAPQGGAELGVSKSKKKKGKKKKPAQAAPVVPGDGSKGMLLHGNRLMLRGVGGCDGRMFDAKRGQELWRPGQGKADKTAGEPALLSSTVVVTLALDAADPRNPGKVLGKLFGKVPKSGALMWRMSLSCPVVESGSSSSTVSLWPLRGDPLEGNALRSCSRTAQQTARFLRFASALRLHHKGKMLYMSTRYITHEARGGEACYHVRSFDAIRRVRSAKKGGGWEHDISGVDPIGGERWHFPPGLPSEGLRSAITALEVCREAIVVGCASGQVLALHPESGARIASIDWLHSQPVSAFASGNGLLWSASSQMAAMRLKPLKSYGVMTAVKQKAMTSRIARYGALYSISHQFWAHLVMLLLEMLQLLYFAFAVRVNCEDAPRWTSGANRTCAVYSEDNLCTSAGEPGDGWYELEFVSYDDDAEAPTLADDADADGIDARVACCACKGQNFLFADLDFPGTLLPRTLPEVSNGTEALLKLPPLVGRVLFEASSFGGDSSQRDIFAWLIWACAGLVGALVLVVLLCDLLKRCAFIRQRAKRYVVLLGLFGVFAQFVTQPAFIPVLHTLARSLHCRYEDDSTWRWMLSSAATGNSSNATLGGSPDDDWSECWAGEHLYIAPVGGLCLILYVALSIRLLRVGGELKLLNVRLGHLCSVRQWCSEDERLDMPHRHPFSMRNPRHRLLMMLLKACAVLGLMFLSEDWPQRFYGSLTAVSFLLLWLSLLRRRAPYHGERANRLRAALDFALLATFGGALVVLLLREAALNDAGQSMLGRSVWAALGRPGAGYWSEGAALAELISAWHPYGIVPAGILGWLLRPLLHGLLRCCCGSGKKRRVQPMKLSPKEEETAAKKRQRPPEDLDEAAGLGEGRGSAPPPAGTIGRALWATVDNRAMAAATLIQSRQRGIAARRQAAAAAARGVPKMPPLLQDKDGGAPKGAPLHEIQREFDGGARGDEATHASSLKHGGKLPLVLPTWDFHRGVRELPPLKREEYMLQLENGCKYMTGGPAVVVTMDGAGP